MAVTIEPARVRSSAETMLVAGKDCPSSNGRTYEVRNPYSDAVVATVPDATIEDLERAVAEARRAFDDGVWADRHPRDRAQVLSRVVEMLGAEQQELAEVETAMLGAPIRMTSNFLVGGAVLFADGLADLAGRDLDEALPLQMQPLVAAQMIRHLPVGVVGAIAPWNFPLLSGVFKLFPALAAGNSVVLKPAPNCPLTTLRLGRMLREAGVPDGVVNIITGNSVELGVRLTDHPDVDMISFTGSTGVGRQVAQQAAGGFKRCILELGGKSPVVILPNADLELCVDASLFAVYMSSGQFCEAGTRVLVSEGQYDEFVERLVARGATLKLGDPAAWDTDLGPLVSQAQRDRVLDYIRSGKHEGAECVLGGKQPAGLSPLFVEPTIFAGAKNDMRVAREEIFGPVLSVIRYSDVDEALRLANDTPYGLAAAVFGHPIGEATQFALKLRAGTVWVNDYHQVSPYRPFGGFKASGVGREMGVEGIKSYTETQSLYVDLTESREAKFYGMVCSTDPC